MTYNDSTDMSSDNTRMGLGGICVAHQHNVSLKKCMLNQDTGALMSIKDNHKLHWAATGDCMRITKKGADFLVWPCPFEA